MFTDFVTNFTLFHITGKMKINLLGNILCPVLFFLPDTVYFITRFKQSFGDRKRPPEQSLPTLFRRSRERGIISDIDYIP